MSTVEITLENFEPLLSKGGIVVLDAWASWCGPCRAFAPVFEAAAARHPDVTWGKLDTQAQEALAGAFDIRAIPTLLVFREGVLLLKQAGMVPARALDQLVEQAKALDMNDVRQQVHRGTSTAHASFR